MDQDHQIMTREVILWSEWAEFSQDLGKRRVELDDDGDSNGKGDHKVGVYFLFSNRL
jgi:hypothetical protein